MVSRTLIIQNPCPRHNFGKKQKLDRKCSNPTVTQPITHQQPTMVNPSFTLRVQISTASISLLASLIIILMIYISPKRLSSPYRRIIFAVSVADVIQSLALLTGPFSIMEDTPKSLWASGSVGSCELNGFCMAFGSTTVPLYMFVLSLRNYCNMNLKMPDNVFTKKIEMWLHVGIITLMLTTCFFGLGMKAFNPNPSGAFCYFEEYPFLCSSYPDKVGECTRGNPSGAYLSYFVVIVICLCFVGIIVNMTLLCVKSCWIEKVYRTQAGEHEHSSDYNCLRDYLRCVPCRNYDQLLNELDGDYVLRLYKKETIIQSFLYIGAFFVSYIFPVLQTIGSFFSYKFPFQIPVLVSFVYPLGGLFNILVYTRPKVMWLRLSYPEFSRFKALCLVIRNGGELPDVIENDVDLNCCCCSVSEERVGTSSLRSSDLEPESSRSTIYDFFRNCPE